MRWKLMAAVLALGMTSPAIAQQAIPCEYLLTAIREGDANKFIGSLDKSGHIANVRGFDGWTPLAAAVEKRNMSFATYLIDKGADPNLATREGLTPLIIATQLRWDEGASMLLQSGAKVDGTNRQGETPLILAVQLRNTLMVRRLLQAGADPDKTDHAAGYSARDYAKRDNRVRDILRLIETARPAPAR
jgi:ankyrin repeat protein